MMRTQYHYLVAGLPDLLFDDTKLQIDLGELRKVYAETVVGKDSEIINLFFYRYDNQNILNRLKDPECAIDPRGVLSAELLEQIFAACKEGSFKNDITGVPAYFDVFLTAWYNDTAVFENKSWELQLSELYYDFAISIENHFIRDWFIFERDLTNLATASQCRKHKVNVENQMSGKGELVDKLMKSNARDFGLDNEFPFLDQILKALESNDLKDFELGIDRVKWDYLDEEVFFYYFTIEKVFSYLTKVAIIERWLSLDKETGQQLFNELLSNLENSYEFPEEFKSKK